MLKKFSDKQKLIAIIASAALVLAVITFILVIKLATPIPKTSDGKTVEHPYSMLVNGREVMLVKSKAEGSDALAQAVKIYTPEDTTFKNVTYDKKITFREKEIKPFKKLSTVLSAEEAAQKIIDRNMSEKPLFKATVVSEKFKEKSIAPKVKFKYDKNMGLFEYKVVTEGKEGTKSTRYEWTSENGEIISKEKKETTVTLEVVDAVVKTGYDDTPKDLKWANYEKYQKKVQVEEADSIVGDKMVEYGKEHLGAPYKVGGKSYETGIDCVQFVRDVYRQFGIELPGRRPDLAHVGKGVSLKDAKPGDIVYYGNHVAMYIGNGKIIHATHKGISIRGVNYRKWSTIRHIKKK